MRSLVRQGTLLPHSFAPGPAILAVLVLGLAVFALAGLAAGARGLSLPTVITALIAPDPAIFDHVALWRFRLPRVVAAILAGSGLALAGMVLQSVLRNPLAEPQILGLNAGATLACVIAVSAGAGGLAGLGPVAALGAFAALAVVLAISGAGGAGMKPLRVTLVGLLVSAFAGAIASALLLWDRGTHGELRGWLAGDLAGQSWAAISAVLPIWGAGVGLALWLAPGFGILSLGDVTARGLGVSLTRMRLAAILSAALLAGSSVGLVGPVGFLGLVVPHLLRPVFGPDSRMAYVAAILTGAILLLVADLAARFLISPAEIPTGILTGTIGAVCFIFLALRLTK